MSVFRWMLPSLRNLLHSVAGIKCVFASIACVVQALSNTYGILFYSLVLPTLANLGQAGKMVARLPLFWSQCHQRHMFPGAQILCYVCILHTIVLLHCSFNRCSCGHAHVGTGGCAARNDVAQASPRLEC